MNNMKPELRQLHQNLLELQSLMSEQSRQNFSRYNPFYEDLFDWKKRGKDWCGEDRNVTIYNSAILIGNVQIGDNTWIGPNTALDGSGGLTIGRFCSISSGVQIVTHDTLRWSLSGGQLEPEREAVEIGDYCFLGSNAVVTKGIKIGNSCVVGANSVVTKNVKPNSIVAGVPARKIGKVENQNGVISLKYNK